MEKDDEVKGFNNLLKHSEKINTIKNTLINDDVEK